MQKGTLRGPSFEGFCDASIRAFQKGFGENLCSLAELHCFEQIFETTKTAKSRLMSRKELMNRKTLHFRQGCTSRNSGLLTPQNQLKFFCPTTEKSL